MTFGIREESKEFYKTQLKFTQYKHFNSPLFSLNVSFNQNRQGLNFTKDNSICSHKGVVAQLASAQVSQLLSNPEVESSSLSHPIKCFFLFPMVKNFPLSLYIPFFNHFHFDELLNLCYYMLYAINTILYLRQQIDSRTFIFSMFQGNQERAITGLLVYSCVELPCNGE